MRCRKKDSNGFQSGPNRTFKLNNLTFAIFLFFIFLLSMVLTDFCFIVCKSLDGKILYVDKNGKKTNFIAKSHIF